MQYQQPYPKWKYHRTEHARLVRHEVEESELGEGWVNDPGEFLIQDALALETSTSDEAPTVTAPVPDEVPKPKRSHHKKKPAPVATT